MHGDGANDEQVQHWLGWLRDGTDTEKIAARRGLARVCERRGMLEEAIELLENNVRAGVRSGELFRWLARLYHEQGDETRSLAAIVEASKYRSDPVTSGPALSADLQAVPPPSRTGRTLVLYLLVLIVLGVAVGMALWLVVPLLRP